MWSTLARARASSIRDFIQSAGTSGPPFPIVISSGRKEHRHFLDRDSFLCRFRVDSGESTKRRKSGWRSIVINDSLGTTTLFP